MKRASYEIRYCAECQIDGKVLADRRTSRASCVKPKRSVG